MNKLLFDLIRLRDRKVRVSNVSWSPDLKVWRNWLKPGISWVRLVTGGVSRSWVIQLSVFAKLCVQLARGQGIKGLVLYLKTAQVVLMQNLKGSKLKYQPRAIGKVAVSRAADGLPRCIPRFARDQIRRGNTVTLRLWLTFFGIYRILQFVGKPKFNTIVQGGPQLTQNFRNEWSSYIKTGFLPLVGSFTGTSLVGISPAETLKRPEPLTIHSASADSTKLEIRGPDGELIRTEYDSSFASRFNSASRWVEGSWGWDLFVYLSFLTGGVGTTKSLWTQMEETAALRSRWSGVDRKIAPRDFSPRGSDLNGRLACLPEPAGKVRVVALVDYWTQAALFPLHDWLFDILREIPTDGTFDQLAPVKRLLRLIKDDTVVYSYDLSAATDRLSIKAQMLLLSGVFGPKFSVAWKRLLVNRTYWVWDVLPSGKPGHVPLRYAQGQPMGAYSSWAMLALTHHAMVQFAAYKVGIRGWFDRYAVLGDDIVIADCRVASSYTEVCKHLGVEIGIAKSLVSEGKTLEFAKKFFRNGEDLSGLPVAFWAAARKTMGVAHALSAWYPTGTMYNFVRALGAGFKGPSALGSHWGKIPLRLRVLAVFLTHPLGGGKFAFKEWAEWLWSWGPMESRVSSLGDLLTQFTPFATGMLEEVVAPCGRTLDSYQEDLFFTESVGDPAARAAITRSNRLLNEALDSLTKAEKSLKHLQRLNIKFMLHQVSAILTQVMRSLSKCELVSSPPVRSMIKRNEDQLMVNVADNYRVWHRLRSRVLDHANRKVGAQELRG